MKDDLLTTTFEVFAGKGESWRVFTVHEDVITQRSKLLRAARQQSKNWDQKNKAGMLKDEDPQVFSAYLHAVYIGVESLRKRIAEDAAGNNARDDSKDDKTARFLVDLYLLADKLLDPVTANLVIDELASFFDVRSTHGHAVTIHVYDSTKDGSPLRRFVRDIYVHDVCSFWASDPHELPYVFLQDVLNEMSRLKMDNPPGIVEDVYAKCMADRQKGGHYHQEVEHVERLTVLESMCLAC